MSVDVSADAVVNDGKPPRKNPGTLAVYPPDFPWDTILWDDFHAQYPKVSQATYYRYKAMHRTPVPSFDPAEGLIPVVEGTEDLTELEEKIVSKIVSGLTETGACEACGVDLGTYLRMCRKSATFELATKKALELSDKHVKDVLTKNVIEWGKRQWQSSAWYLERKYPQEFGRKDGNASQTTVNVGIKLQVRDRAGNDISDKCSVTAEASPGAKAQGTHNVSRETLPSPRPADSASEGEFTESDVS